MGFEPTTTCLASTDSTTELHPQQLTSYVPNDDVLRLPSIYRIIQRIYIYYLKLYYSCERYLCSFSSDAKNAEPIANTNIKIHTSESARYCSINYTTFLILLSAPAIIHPLVGVGTLNVAVHSFTPVGSHSITASGVYCTAGRFCILPHSILLRSIQQ